MLINEREVNGRLFVQDPLSPEFRRYMVYDSEKYDTKLDYTNICVSWDEFEELKEIIYDIKMRERIQNNLIKAAVFDSLDLDEDR